MPGVAALPAAGTWATTLPPLAPANLDFSFMCRSSARASVALIPTTLGTTPYTARETTSRTFWYAESVPSAGDCPTTIPGSLPGFAGA